MSLVLFLQPRLLLIKLHYSHLIHLLYALGPLSCHIDDRVDFESISLGRMVDLHYSRLVLVHLQHFLHLLLQLVFVNLSLFQLLQG